MGCSMDLVRFLFRGLEILVEPKSINLQWLLPHTPVIIGAYQLQNNRSGYIHCKQWWGF
jgi:hypothetical protein